MIYERLAQDYKTGRLYNSYLVSSNDCRQSLYEINKFLAESIFIEPEEESKESDISTFTHPDLYKCAREEVTSKNITVDQIRKLREFIHKSSVISGYKVGIIEQADLMNVNASNSCLKMLEDTPPNSLLILATELPAALLPTIRSRCARISHHYEGDVSDAAGRKDYIQFLQLFGESGSVSDRHDFIKEFANKDRARWVNLAVNLENLLGKYMKLRTGIAVELSSSEKAILDRFRSASSVALDYKYEQVSSLLKETVEFDLDLKASTIMLMEYFNR